MPTDEWCALTDSSHHNALSAIETFFTAPRARETCEPLLVTVAAAGTPGIFALVSDSFTVLDITIFIVFMDFGYRNGEVIEKELFSSEKGLEVLIEGEVGIDYELRQC